MEADFFVNGVRCQLWTVLGISGLLKCQTTKQAARAFVASNVQGLLNITRSVVKRFLVREIKGPSAPKVYEDKVDFITHHYDFIYHLEGLIEIAQGDVQGHYDDVLMACLQIYYTSFFSTLNARFEALPEVLAVLEEVGKALDQTTELSQQDIQRAKKECEDWRKELALV